MKPPWREDVGILPWLALIFLALAVILLFKSNYLSKDAFKNDKDFYAALSSLVTILVLTLGAGLSYIRFFKGRTLQPKINLELKAGVVQVKDENLHWIEVEIKNSGSVTIWHYKTTIVASLIKAAITCKVDVTDFVNAYDPLQQILLIDVGESAYEHALLLVPREVDVVSFQVEVRDKGGDESGHSWMRVITVKNLDLNQTKDSPIVFPKGAVRLADERDSQH
jgi:hypothetical protein